MNLININFDEIKLERSNDFDLISFSISKLKKESEYLILFPFELFYIESVKTDANFEIFPNVHQLHYLICIPFDDEPIVNISVKCRLKYFDERKPNFKYFKNPIDRFNKIEKNSSDFELISSNNFEPIKQNPYPYVLNFIVSKKDHLIEIEKFFNVTTFHSVNIYNNVSNEKFIIKSWDQLKAVKDDISFDNIYSSKELYFEDNYPLIDIYINFSQGLIPPQSPSIIHFDFNNLSSYELVEQVSYLKNVTHIPEKEKITRLLDKSESYLLNPNSSDSYYLPIFTYENFDYFYLKKKFQSRQRQTSGKLIYEFYAYTFDYEVRDYIENKVKSFFEEIFILLKPKNESSLVSFGVDYYKNGRVSAIKAKNREIFPKDLLIKIEDFLLNTEMMEYQHNYYVIYFFETYFE
ncbi:hypothetical protein OAQ99_01820 [Candidatus Kapabacteria bacterium]|nr:hypothetical protein [Candidatus Kapabacteria bacterium]